MMINSPTLRSEDKEIARAKLAILAIQSAMAGGGREHYFVLARNQTLNDLINFMLWQKKADELGIRFTPDDVKTMVQREFFGEFKAPLQVAVQKQLAQGMPGFTIDSCLRAVAEEFRVRTAADRRARGRPTATGGTRPPAASPCSTPPTTSSSTTASRPAPPATPPSPCRPRTSCRRCRTPTSPTRRSATS